MHRYTDDGTGLHHMVYEVVDNSIDEALRVRKEIIIEINKDERSSLTMEEEYQLIYKEKKSAAEVIMTQLMLEVSLTTIPTKFLEDFIKIWCIGGNAL